MFPVLFRCGGLPITRCDISNSPNGGIYTLCGLINGSGVGQYRYFFLLNHPSVEIHGPAH